MLQKKFVQLATFNDLYPPIPGTLVHTPPLFHKLNLLNIFDIYKLQVGKLVYDSLNNIGPVQGIISFMRASESHSHVTRFSTGGRSISIVRHITHAHTHAHTHTHTHKQASY